MSPATAASSPRTCTPATGSGTAATTGRPGTLVEYAQGLSDQLNAWHSKTHDLQVDDFTRTTRSMHFYDSIVVFERGEVTPPYSRTRGQDFFDVRDGGGQGSSV